MVPLPPALQPKPFKSANSHRHWALGVAILVTVDVFDASKLEAASPEAVVTVAPRAFDSKVPTITWGCHRDYNPRSLAALEQELTSDKAEAILS